MPATNQTVTENRMRTFVMLMMYHSTQLYIDATEVLKEQEKLEKTSFVPRCDRCSCLVAKKMIS